MSFRPSFGRVVRRLTLGTTAAILLGGFYELRPDRMMVEHVEFHGMARATPAALRHVADVRNGTRIWEVDVDATARAVERHPWVRSASVRRVFPNRLVIDVDEFRPVALVHADRILYVANDGTLFMPADSADLDYPNLTGFTATLAAQHPDLPRLVVRDGLKLLQSLDTRGLVATEDIDEIHFLDTRGFTVRTGRSRILFGLSDFERQLDRLSALMDHDRVDLSRPLHIDLGPENVAIVRPISPPAEG